MKFKDKDGNVFEDIVDAVVYKYCCKYRIRGCVCCPWHDRDAGQFGTCYVFATTHPAEAARLMGYEVVEDKCDTCANENPSIECVNCGSKHWNYRPQEKEANMEKQKHLSEWTLGEAVTECRKHSYCDKNCPFEKGDGDCRLFNSGAGIAASWDLTEEPRFTEEEVADARVLARALKATGFKRGRYEDIYATSDTASDTLLDSEMFPSIRPGTSVKLNEIVGDDP